MTAPPPTNKKLSQCEGVDIDTDVSVSASTSSLQLNQNIKVAVRLRQLRDRQENRSWIVDKTGATTALIQKGLRKVEDRTIFHFDQIFDEDAKTPLVYKNIARPMVRAVLNGKHATIFAYGQTGSGKTFTMQGDGKIGSGKTGIIQLVTSDLFRLMLKGDAAKRDFGVKVSYFEIYNEKIRDLLLSGDAEGNTSSSSSSSSIINKKKREEHVKIRINAFGDIVVNIIQKKVYSAEDIIELLIEGNSHRTVAVTDINEKSSRSHSVFRITVESRDGKELQPVENQGQEIVRVSDFNLVDLAGSESLKATNSTGNRKREGATINKSLLALTTVIQSLSQPIKKRPQHINYRDSKLTRILQPHLSGNAEMAILCCASPSKAFVEETRSTLKFAARAKLVEIKPKVNEIMDDGVIINKLQKKLSKVRKQLAELKLQEQSREPIVIDRYRIDDSVDNQDTNAQSRRRVQDYGALENGDVAKKTVRRYTRGRINSVDPDDQFHSCDDNSADQSGAVESFDSPDKQNTEPTEDDSFDNPEGSYAEISLKLGSQISNPETILGLCCVGDRGRSRFVSTDSGDIAPNGRLENSWSWDTTSVKVGQPLRALRNLTQRNSLIPDEVTIIDTISTTGNNKCFTDRLNDAQSRAKFLEGKLDVSNDVIETTFRDLERARHCIHDLVQRNVQMKAKLNKKQREDTKEEYERQEVMVEQYWILKVSLYISLLFFLSGSQELFLATVIFVWLVLEG